MPLIRKPDAAAPAPETASDLAGASADARWAAARAMTAPGDVDALAKALSHEQNPRVREAILTSLARIGTRQSAGAVAPLIASDDAQLRAGALDALRAMPGAVAELLPALLTDADADVRLLACELARVIPEGAATAMMCDLLDRETEVNVCASAIEVLTEVGSPEALPALERCATRFADPFLTFSARVAAERIGGRR